MKRHEKIDILNGVSLNHLNDNSKATILQILEDGDTRFCSSNILQVIDQALEELYFNHKTLPY